MYFHGIDLKYLKQKFPYLYPESHVSAKNPEQLADRARLIEQFGFEPVHLLESSPDYSIRQCINACFRFGDIALAFSDISEPLIQLSEHEIGVPFIDARECRYIVTRRTNPEPIRALGLEQTIVFWRTDRMKKKPL